MQILHQTKSKGSDEKFRVWSVNIARLLLAVAFGMAGTMKLTSAPDMVAMFDNIGLGQWFRYFTGGMEIFAALLMIFRRTVLLGLIALAGILAGAFITHIFVIGGSMLPAAVLSALVLFVFVMRKP